MAPTEHTLIGACQARCCLHAAVTVYTVETVFVAAPAASQHGLQS
jgi:hypothetical protein